MSNAILKEKQNNKKEFHGALRRQIVYDQQNKGLIRIDESFLKTLCDLKIANPTEYKHRKRCYSIRVGDLSVIIIEMKNGYFKMISEGTAWDKIKEFSWSYKKGNIWANNTKGKDYLMERLILDVDEENFEVHHMWYRAVALDRFIVKVTGDEHDKIHDGNRFARNQVIVWRNKNDFITFWRECTRVIESMTCG